jgi:hypothetical protein
MIVDFPAAAGRLSIGQETKFENRNSKIAGRRSNAKEPSPVFGNKALSRGLIMTHIFGWTRG